VTHEAELRADGTLAGTLRFAAGGATDGRLRRMLSQSRKRSLTDLLAETLAPLGPAVRVTRVTHRVLDDFTGDMWLVADYEVPGFAMRVGPGLEFSPPAVRAVKDHPLLFGAGSEKWSAKRETDVFLYNTQRLEVNERIRMPDGYRLAAPPKVDAVDETYAGFEGKVTQSGSSVELRSRTEVRRRQIPPSGYAGFKQALDALDGYADLVVRVEKGGAR